MSTPNPLLLLVHPFFDTLEKNYICFAQQNRIKGKQFIYIQRLQEIDEEIMLSNLTQKSRQQQTGQMAELVAAKLADQMAALVEEKEALERWLGIK